MKIQERLLEAIREGDGERVRALLEAGASASAEKWHDESPLSIAAEAGNADVVKALLDAGADPERYFDMPPLLEAASSGNLACVKLLLEAGAPVDQPDEDGGTPLMSAALKGHYEIVEYLVARGADVDAWDRAEGETALSYAASKGKTRVYEFLKPRADAENQAYAATRVQEGLEWARRLARFHPKTEELREAILAEAVEQVRSLYREIPGDAVDEQGRHPIWYAAKVGNREILEITLQAGAPVNVLDLRDGRSALHVAVIQGHPDAARLLLEAGAEVDARDAQGETPLLAACDHEASLECVQLLLAAGADPNARDQRGQTPLMHGCDGWSGDFTEGARILKEAGADLDARDARGASAFVRACRVASEIAAPDRVREGAAASAAGLAALGARFEGGQEAELVLACHRGHSRRVSELIAAGADVNREVLGLTPLGQAARGGHAQVVEQLLRAGAHPDAGQVRGPEMPLADAAQTPLMEAAQKGHVEVARLLIEAGAEVDAQCFGYSVLHGAAQYGGLGIVKLLLEAGADPSLETIAGETAAELAWGDEQSAIVAALNAAAKSG